MSYDTYVLSDFEDTGHDIGFKALSFFNIDLGILSYNALGTSISSSHPPKEGNLEDLLDPLNENLVIFNRENYLKKGFEIVLTTNQLVDNESIVYRSVKEAELSPQRFYVYYKDSSEPGPFSYYLNNHKPSDDWIKLTYKIDEVLYSKIFGSRSSARILFREPFDKHRVNNASNTSSYGMASLIVTANHDPIVNRKVYYEVDLSYVTSYIGLTGVTVPKDYNVGIFLDTNIPNIGVNIGSSTVFDNLTPGFYPYSVGYNPFYKRLYFNFETTDFGIEYDSSLDPNIRYIQLGDGQFELMPELVGCLIDLVNGDITFKTSLSNITVSLQDHLPVGKTLLDYIPSCIIAAGPPGYRQHNKALFNIVGPFLLLDEFPNTTGVETYVKLVAEPTEDDFPLRIKIAKDDSITLIKEYGHKGYIRSYVQVDVPPLFNKQSRVYLFDLRTETIVDVTMSDPLTGEYFFLYIDLEGDYLVFSYDLERQRNAVIKGPLKATEMPPFMFEE